MKIDRSALEKKYGDESVMVVKKESLPSMTEGFICRSEEAIPLIVNNAFFEKRYNAEYNQGLRQPIPYIILRCKDKFETYFFAMTRLDGSGETRLNGKVTLGAGGHINPIDAMEGRCYDIDISIPNAITRELWEELGIPTTQKTLPKFIGLINDNSNPVSQDHLGLVYIVDVDDTDIKVKETDNLEGKFYTIGELIEFESRMESWSQLALQAITKNIIGGNDNA